jgi:hypothetical protein
MRVLPLAEQLMTKLSQRRCFVVAASLDSNPSNARVLHAEFSRSMVNAKAGAHVAFLMRSSSCQNHRVCYHLDRAQRIASSQHLKSTLFDTK